MKRALIAIALLMISSSAHAAYTVNILSNALSDPFLITAGQSISFWFNIYFSPAYVPDQFNYDIPYATDAGIISGDGQGQSNGLIPISDTGITLVGPFTFRYDTPGTYIVQAVGDIYLRDLFCDVTQVCLIASSTASPEVIHGLKLITVNSAVPEPATWLLLLIGFALLAGRAGRSWKPRPALAARSAQSPVRAREPVPYGARHATNYALT